jgi:ubiquinone/menaquinone biosynthesis C-methylase UbiE
MMSIHPKSPAGEFAGGLLEALRAIHGRPQPAVPWRDGENLPWDDPAFSERMLAQHLDQSHGAASRPLPELRALVQTMSAWLRLEPGMHLLDVTCGPGLYAAEFARRGLAVTGVDFGPASIRYARKHCAGLDCHFLQADVRSMQLPEGAFDAAIYLYGQSTVLRPEEAREVLGKIRLALRPGGRLLLEILDEERLDKQNSSWWYTDSGGLWGDFPYLHLGERTWDAELRAVIERFYVLNLESGELRSYALSDQAYTVEQFRALLAESGFTTMETHPAWGGLAVKDAPEWVVYVAERG